MRAQAARRDDVFVVSALNGAGVGDLLDAIAVRLEDATQACELRLAFDEGRKRAWLFEQGVVQSETQTEDGFVLQVEWTARQQSLYYAM